MKRLGLWALLVLLLAAAMLLGWWGRARRREHSQDQLIYAAARRYGVDPALVKAVVWRESRFNPKARGRAGELGLMQVMDPAAQEWAEAEHRYPLPESCLLDPVTNTLAGTWYLRKMLRRYQLTDNPLPYALADYNAGRGNVLKWTQGAAATNSDAFLEQIGLPGTKDYVLSIQKRREQYRRDFPP